MNDRDLRWSSQGLPKFNLHRATIVASLGGSIIVWLRSLTPILLGRTAMFAWEGLLILDEDVGRKGL